jgi:hypothetical protein
MKIKFIDHSKELHQNIYLIKNFFDEEELKNYEIQLEKIEDKSWKEFHQEYSPHDLAGRYWYGKLSPDIIHRSFHEKLINLFAPTHWILSNFNFVRLISEEKSITSPSADPVFEYKIAIYFGEWEGGEISFPELNFSYLPEYGDMLIIKNAKEYQHITGVVKSGTRYAYQDYLIKHPGYFMP